ncbi:MAG: hypothetical protein II623_10195, partial [Paludibacteraceae bacterium]|nr:hypothetical protein [Paludibacteraceae bacterium]
YKYRQPQRIQQMSAWFSCQVGKQFRPWAPPFHTILQEKFFFPTKECKFVQFHLLTQNNT